MIMIIQWMDGKRGGEIARMLNLNVPKYYGRINVDVDVERCG